MKKFFVTMTIILSLAISAMAGGEEVKPEITKAFRKDFGRATEVTWTGEIQQYKVNFLLDGKWYMAYYSHEAQLLGMARNMPSTELPAYLLKTLRREYIGYWITDLYELSNQTGYSYYITIRNADETIVLRSKNGGLWKTFLNDTNQ